MESFEVDKTLYDIGEQDLKELWGNDFDSPMNDFGSDQDWTNLLDHQPVVLNDRMITDAAQSPRIQSEHSYSLTAGDDLPGSPLGMHDKYKLEDFGKDLDESECFSTMPMNSGSGGCSGVGNDSSSSSSSSLSDLPRASMRIKREPLSEPGSPQPMMCSSPFSELRRHHHSGLQQQQHSHHHQMAPHHGGNHHHHSHHHSFMHRSLSDGSGSMSGSDSNDSLMDGISNAFSGSTSSGMLASSSSTTLLKQPTIVLATGQKSPGRAGRQSMFPKVKVETAHSSAPREKVLRQTGPRRDGRRDFCGTRINQSVGGDGGGSGVVQSARAGFSLPPTPPSSNSSDSEGSLSPVYLQPPSSPTGLLSCPSSGSSSRKAQRMMSSSGLYTISSKNSNSQLISSQPKGATGVLMLTEEEKRTLLAEGYPIPTRLPLTKAEEKSLKKIRRKIKNKISAQESRRKKKEYMDALEKKVENLASENNDYKRRMDSLENNNKSLLTQLHKLQGMMGELPSKMSRTVYTQTSTPSMPKRASVKLGKS